MFRQIFQNDDTIVFHELLPLNNDNVRICVVYTVGMADQKEISKGLISAVLNSPEGSLNRENMVNSLKKQIISCGNIEINSDVDKIVGSILYGDTLIIADNCPEALIVDLKGLKLRDISEPLSENVVRGPRDAFTESLIINTSLIRRRVNNPNLKFRFDFLGTQTKTRICICHINGLSNDKILQEVNDRIKNIRLDAVLESGYIEEIIRDHPLSLFSTVGHTERPDKLVSGLLEGRIAIIVDGTPIALTVPFLFSEYFQSSEDYYNDFISGSVNRLLRWGAFFLSTSIPAIYVALTSFRKEIIPTPLLLTISASRVDVPFPTIIEMFIMVVVFEILREGGSRLPVAVGSTISFVGAVVIGDAAVNAKFVSAPIVIIVAVTGLSNFLIPKLMSSLSIVRIILLLFSGVIGFYGYLFGAICLFIHLLSMNSFGVPYMLSISSLNAFEAKDTGIRVPWWVLRFRAKKQSQIDAGEANEEKS
ncbi:spore germination protein KA [Anaerobacterium chartisolvens]|uniref:Spore germination protein KA n=1 Tax=Anaerobacterium chartisolvens TaxID=1297424 RepID=A0A369AUE7_9FIRM|nr:spore germination protein [Anaerobacterium chartisolvens]RCX13000.1 spore germination protein KA [Anaerobacterium chartisolvens]